ncbi:hypothetical protein AVEN_21675-1 [Araneus ventricosus]|uniref:Uncharacterized protein n=1 Tax=Araneus ventricosus TaxID=182803 RepID=A0A4Y2NJ82_ARAVE|nr:hypothetical protein AVEN_21675-1 [Araneus ventricosus]
MKELKYAGSDACKEIVAKAQGGVQLYKRQNNLLVPSSSVKEASSFYNRATDLPCNEVSDQASDDKELFLQLPFPLHTHLTHHNISSSVAPDC